MSETSASGGNVWTPSAASNLGPARRYKRRLIVCLSTLAILITVTVITQNLWANSFEPNIVDGNTLTVVNVNLTWHFALFFSYMQIALWSSITVKMILNKNRPQNKQIGDKWITVLAFIVVALVALFTLSSSVDQATQGTTYAEWLADDVKTSTELLNIPFLDKEIAAYEGIDKTTVLVKRTEDEESKTTVYTKQIIPTELDFSNK